MPVSYAKLFERMEQRGLKKVDLRKTYKINPKTVDSLVNNRSVTVDTIIQLCEILDCQPGDLMEYVREGVQYNNGFPERRRRLPKAPKSAEKRPDCVSESQTTLLRT